MFGFFKDKFEGLKQAVSNTAKSLVADVLSNVDENEEEYSEFALDDIEDTLISADLGVNYAAELVDKLRSKKNTKPSELKNYLREEFKKVLREAGSTELNYKDGELNIYFITGVNGAGKTTLIAKLAYKFKQSGKRVLVAAGDTFNGAFAVAIAEGRTCADAIAFAQKASAISVTRLGAQSSVPYRREIH